MDEHICGFSFLDELENTFTAGVETARDAAEFRCGSCTKPFRVMCFLHEHLRCHGNGGSYYYDSFLRTAFPKYGTHCSSTQTSDYLIGNTDSVETGITPAAADKQMVDKSQQTDSPAKTANKYNSKLLKLTKSRRQTKANVVNTFLESIEVKEEDDSKYGIPDNAYDDSSEVRYPKADVQFSTNNTPDVTIDESPSENKSDTTSEVFTDMLYQFGSYTFGDQNNTQETPKLRKRIKRQRLSIKRVNNINKCSKVKDKRHKETDDEDIGRHIQRKRIRKCERPTLVCDMCGKTIQRRELKVHMRYHTGERPYVCDVCPKAFVSLKKLNYHKKRHSGMKAYQCHVCVASYYTTSELYKHIKEQHSGIVHSCSVCEATFKSKVGLDLHTRNVHMGEKNFTCDKCDKRFTQKGHLKYHLLQHNGLVYTCTCCNKQFKDRSAMKRHEKTHSNVKPHVCHICNHGSIQKGPFYVHMERHHGMTKEQVNAHEKQMREYTVPP